MLEAVALALALAAAEQQMPGNCGYPCNHYLHVAEGAAVAMVVSHYYGEDTAWKVGLGLAVGAELVGRLQGKKMRVDDIATRALGTGAGIWLYRRF